MPVSHPVAGLVVESGLGLEPLDRLRRECVRDRTPFPQLFDRLLSLIWR